MQKTVFLSIASAVLLSACGGGGGGTSATLGPFINFSSIPEGAFTQTLDGISQEVGFTQTPEGIVTGVGVISEPGSGARATIGENAAGQINASFSTTAGTNAAFNEAAGDTFGDIGGITATDSSDFDRSAFVINPFAVVWEYQTFGVWLTGLNGTSGRVATGSFGAPTAASGIPSSGNASYSGFAAGVHVDAAGNATAVEALMTASANFTDRTLAFSTTNTIDILEAPGTPQASLNLNGTLTYSPGVNGFTGPVTSASGGLSGTAAGRFYGPNAQELGGTFGLRGPGTSTYLGGFGGVRQ